MYRSSRLPRHRGGRATTPSRYIDGQGPLPRRGPPRDLEPRRLCSHFPFRRDARKPQFRMPHGNLRRGDTPRGQVRTCGRRRGRYISFACSPCADCILSHLGRFVKSCSRVTNQQKLGVQTDFDALFRPTLGGMNKKRAAPRKRQAEDTRKTFFSFVTSMQKRGRYCRIAPENISISRICGRCARHDGHACRGAQTLGSRLDQRDGVLIAPNARRGL